MADPAPATALRDEVTAWSAALSARLAPGGPRGQDGVALGQARARGADRTLGDAFARAVSEAAPPCAVALAAVGSYGRGAVALGSDLDVRVLVPRGESGSAEVARFAERLLYPLWDAGLSVGHQVAEGRDLLDLAATDLASATSLLDLRLVAGDGALVDDVVRRAFEGVFSEGNLGAFLARLEAEAEARSARFGGSVYLLEPDVKSGPGGLRDLDLARWASRARFRVGEAGASPWQDLVRVGVLLPREASEIAFAEELLHRVRNRLHAASGRRSDRLTFDQQEAIAWALGYGPRGASPSDPSEDPAVRGEAAERFMQDYYLQARVVSRARESLRHRAEPPRRRHKPTIVDLGGGLVLFDGHVGVGAKDLDSSPVLALRAYAACVQRRAPLLPYAREAIARAAADPGFGERLRASPEAATLFVQLACTVQDVPTRTGSMIAELHDVGLLLAMIPEFSPVTGRVHHDVYHVYTVDVHSVAAVDCLRALCRGDVVQARPLASRLAAELTRPRPLFLATLLHDVGKGWPDADGSRRSHSKTGAELCDVILPRLGVPADEVADARALVEQHLDMYHVATRRDLDDPSTVTEFAAKVRGRAGLRELYLLTVSDVSTTSPTAMTSWKARMLEELYLATDAWLEGGVDSRFDDARREAARAAVVERGVAEGADLDGVRAFLEGMPDRYVLSNLPEQVLAHASVAHAGGARPWAARFVPSRHAEVAELCVVARDEPGLLARLTAAVTASRLEILAAQVYTREVAGATQAVDLFWVRERAGGVPDEARALARLEGDLDALLVERVEPADFVRARVGVRSPWSERPSPRVLTEVVVDGRSSPRHTLLEVFAKDRPGLLFEIACALHGLGLGIASSKINTEGTKVADVFYVTERGGAKVQGAERVREIREALLTVAEGEDPRPTPSSGGLRAHGAGGAGGAEDAP